MTTLNQRVTGSIPVAPTKQTLTAQGFQAKNQFPASSGGFQLSRAVSNSRSVLVPNCPLPTRSSGGR